MGFFDDLFGSDTELVDQSQPYVIPEAGRTYADPAMEYAARQLLGSYFGGPGQPGMLSQPIPISMDGVGASKGGRLLNRESPIRFEAVG